MPAFKRADGAGETFVNGRWPKLMQTIAVTAIFPLYEITTATEARRLVLAFLEYGLLACAVMM